MLGVDMCKYPMQWQKTLNVFLMRIVIINQIFKDYRSVYKVLETRMNLNFWKRNNLPVYYKIVNSVLFRLKRLLRSCNQLKKFKFHNFGYYYKHRKFLNFTPFDR